MKKILITLTFCLLIPYVAISQDTNIVLSQEQGTEVVKGLEQGENLKQTVLDLEKALLDAEAIIAKQKQQLLNKEHEISLLNLRIENFDDRISGLNREFELEEALLKDRLKKRFGFGVSSGLSLGEDFKVVPYIGVGFTWNLFRF